MEQRKQQIASMMLAMEATWPQIRLMLQDRKQDYIDNLIAQDNEQTRGRIKEIDDLINLPSTLHQELMAIQDALAE